VASILKVGLEMAARLKKTGLFEIDNLRLKVYATTHTTGLKGNAFRPVVWVVAFKDGSKIEPGRGLLGPDRTKRRRSREEELN